MRADHHGGRRRTDIAIALRIVATAPRQHLTTLSVLLLNPAQREESLIRGAESTHHLDHTETVMRRKGKKLVIYH